MIYGQPLNLGLVKKSSKSIVLLVSYLREWAAIVSKRARHGSATICRSI
ncbi:MULTISPECIES: hypothetical protein [unclassified Microcoleus]